MPREFVVGDTSYHFPDNYTDEQVQTILTKQGIIKAPAAAEAKPQTWAEKLGVTNPVATGAVDLAEGAASGLASTVFHGGDLIRRMTGQPRVINEPDVQQAMREPPSLAGKAGKLGEQTLEFFAPSGVIGKGAKAIEAATAGLRAAKALSIAGRAGLEAATAAGITGLQTGGDTEAMKQAAATAGITTGAFGAAAEGVAKFGPALKESALAQYGRVLNPTKQGTKFLAKTEVAPGLLDRQVAAASLKTLQGKAAAQVQKWGQNIEDAYANLPAGSSADLNSVTQRLDTMAQEFTIPSAGGKAVPMGPHAEAALENIDRLKQTLTDIAQTNPQTGALEVPVDKVRQLRQYFDNIAAKAGRYEGKTLADQSIAEAHGLAADAIREELAQQFPDIAKINKEFAFWKNAQKVVDETVLRRTGQAKPLGRKLAGAAGAAGGFATGGLSGAIVGKKVMDTLEQLTTSTAWGTVSAVTKDRLANALARGSGAEVEFWVRRIANSMGGAKTSSNALQEPATAQ